MTIALIIFGIFIITAFYSGFYIGYLKREDKAPEIPAVKTFKRVIRDIKAKDEEPKSFFD
jgi:hypothetical protein